MSITSLSFSFVNLYAAPSAKPPAERPAAAAPAPAQGCGTHRPGGGENRLAQAMMTALRELGLGGAIGAGSSAPIASTAADDTGAGVAAPVAGAANDAASSAAASASDAVAPAAQEPAATPEAAVYQFAHALFLALRQGGGGRASTDDDGDAGRVDGRGGHRHHHHHHHHHHGERREGYGDLSQRLEALSQTFGSPAPVAVTSAVAAGTVTAPAAVPTASAATEPAASAVAPAASRAKGPLLEAFSKLFGALRPAAAATTTGTAGTAATSATSATSADADLSTQLRLFLHTLAQALRPEAMGGQQSGPVGGLVNVTA